ncbi:response regulator [Streptomyces sp. NPDC001165]|uniref:response regulator n=1 Tax=Streptomyces sp. NPDC001165 TaxID=3364546 RepID=UPI00369BCC3B
MRPRRRCPRPGHPSRLQGPVRILVCDDHAVVRPGLLALLHSGPDIEVVGEAGSGEEVLALARRTTPDVVVMDLQLGEGMDGVEATRRLRALTPAPHVLVLTTYDTDADVTRAIEAGATGYLLKAERAEDLFSVKTHLRRIYDRLGVDTRAGAVAVAKEQRLLP